MGSWLLILVCILYQFAMKFLLFDATACVKLKMLRYGSDLIVLSNRSQQINKKALHDHVED